MKEGIPLLTLPKLKASKGIPWETFCQQIDNGDEKDKFLEMQMTKIDSRRKRKSK